MEQRHNAVILDEKGIKICGEYKVLLCASLFYFRIPEEYWQDRIEMIKNAGYNCVDIYFPWNYHEAADGVWDFEGERDVARFLDMVSKAGLYIVARPGPYICSEWDGGGIPARVVGGDYKIRSNDPKYISEVRKWFAEIIPIIAKYEFGKGGTVILLQVENELDFFDCDDVGGYISSLRDMVREYGITVPIFACAGQSDIYRAGGAVPGVYPTFNFYPNSYDPSFDSVLKYFSKKLQSNGLPFLITETNRDHFILRRELAHGAKLLGAYNQVAGSNFGFNMSINNWGNPLSFISTKYDFGSLVSTMGEFSAEVDAARELSLLIKSFGAELSEAEYEEGPAAMVSRDGRRELSCLRLKSGGYLVNAVNFSDSAQLVEITALGHKFKAELCGRSAPFLPVGVDLSALGVPCRINWSANELLLIDKNRLYFKETKINAASITAFGKEYLAERDCVIGGIEVKFVGRDFLRSIDGFEKGFIKEHEVLSIDRLSLKEGAPQFKKAQAAGALNLEALGAAHGYVKYSFSGFEKGLFLENAADLITVRVDGRNIGTRVSGGECLLFDGGKFGEVKAECWGHSNFDDARLPSLRISSKKGILGAYEVEEVEEQELCYFKLLDDFPCGSVDTAHPEFAPILPVSKWNSTRQPVICMYSFWAQRKSDKLYVEVTKGVECSVFVDGMFVSKGDYGFVDLTERIKEGAKAFVSVVYRKPHWAVDVGKVKLYHLRRLSVSACLLDERQIAAQDYSGGVERQLPLKLERGGEYLGKITLSGGYCRELRVLAKDVKITFSLAGRVIARIIGQWGGAPVIAGEKEAVFYVPGAWVQRGNGELCLYIECVGDEPELLSVLEIKKNI